MEDIILGAKELTIWVNFWILYLYNRPGFIALTSWVHNFDLFVWDLMSLMVVGNMKST